MGQTRITDAVGSAMLEAVVTAFGDDGTIEIYASGTETEIPATADVAIDTVTEFTVIATCTLDSPSFGSPSAGTNEHVITAGTIDDCTDAESGDCLFFRGYDSGGTCVIQGNCGTSNTFDMVMNTVTVASGATVQVTAWTITLPQHEA